MDPTVSHHIRSCSPPKLLMTLSFMRHGEKKHYNNKVDFYSFSFVLWELIQNNLPREGVSNLHASYAAALKGPVLRPNGQRLIADFSSNL
uniref:Serine/threonine-protein kinase HT1-like n=1 Tax=Tanacetum cinerariifolium TaxID=118510 RepID=A0A6L2K516_TANCI|nr:serine/threonine-protein kinase HT1-like [Tanacetum cinerariifolium]